MTLNGIKGYWNSEYLFDFNDDNMYEGKILVDDDGWFEGIVTFSNGTDKFVFGTYCPGESIKLFYISSDYVNHPVMFYGTNDVSGYDGKLEMLDGNEFVHCGVSHVLVSSLENIDRVDTEKSRLLFRVQNFKNGVMNMSDGLVYAGVKQGARNKDNSPKQYVKVFE